MSHSGWSTSNYISAVGGTIPTGYPYTLAIRGKFPSAGTGAGLGLVADSNNYSWVGIYNIGVMRVGVSVKATTEDVIFGGTNLSTATWYSIVCVFRSATDREIYLNGVSDGTGSTSKSPSSFTSARAGLNGAGGQAFPGSLGEGAIWNVALSLSDIQSLGIANVSPLLVRRDALTTYLPLLDSGTLDLMAPAATVTGTLTKDNDHPRVILPRQRSLIIPKSAGGGGEEQAVGSSAGSATAAATGQSTARASSTVAGTSTVAATGRSTAASVANAAGTSTADATGTFTGEVQAVGTAAGTSSASAVGASTGGTTTDTHDGFGYGDPFRRKRRPKKGKREKAVEDLLKKLMGLVPDDPPPAIEAEAEIAQASVERLFAPTVDVTPNLEALQFAQLQLAKLEAMLNRYLEDEDDEDDLLLMAA